ncbi:MAG TPA: SBBP repeat-containing protein, partial [Planctomycetota bacterium]|nr:SBBP repeat-containing protein [Planctomycetota bacterium]
RPSNAQLMEAYGRIPLHFEENRGQVDASARFLARVQNGGTVALEPTGFALLGDGAPLRLTFAGRAAAPAITAEAPLPGVVNYYRGTDPAGWRTGVATYGRVRYAGVYSGVDVVVYGNQRRLEYDFVVAPGADPGAIRMRVDGADRLTLDTNGDLRITRASGTIVQQAPVLYQERDGVREPIQGRYVVRGREIAFAVGAYDRTRPLVIDPVLVYMARIGWGVARSLAVDAAGYAYFAGDNVGAFNGEYPTTPNAAYPNRVTGLDEIFVTKLSPDGSTLVYSTYIGSFDRDRLHAIATDGAGFAYITGRTHDGYPTTPGAFQTTTVAKGEDASLAFVTKFGPTGALIYSTYLQGTTFDNPQDPIPHNVCYQGAGNGIAADSAGHAYVVGSTRTNNFPTTPGAYLPTKPTVGATCNTYGAGFLTKLSPDGASLVYSTYLDGNGFGAGVTVDGSGQAFVTGSAMPPSAPPGALTASLAADGTTVGPYVAKFDASGMPVQTTTLGVEVEGVALGPDGSIYLTGPAGANFKAVNAYQPNAAGASDGYVARLKGDGTAYLWSTYLGGTGGDGLFAIAVDATGAAWVGGATGSADFPLKHSLRPKGPGPEALVAKLSASGGLLLATVLGEGAAYGIGVDGAGNAYVAGDAAHDFLAPTPGSPSKPFQQPPNTSGDENVFVVKLKGDNAPPSTTVDPPAAASVWTGNSLVVGAKATDESGLVNIKLWANGGVIATFPCSGTTCSGTINWSTGPLPPGAYELNAVATDSSGNQTISAKKTVYKDATTPVKASGAQTDGSAPPPPGPPALTAAITSPANGATVSGNVGVTMTTTGSQAPTSFDLKVDKSATLFSGQVSSSTVTHFWSSNAYPNGVHTLDFTVTDGAGRTATASISVTVSNSSPPPPPPLTASITSPANGATVSGDVTVTMATTGAQPPSQFALKVDNSAVLFSGQVTGSTATHVWSTTG